VTRHIVQFKGVQKTTATHGEIFRDGKPINRLAPEARNIGMVFQSGALFPHMTVAENAGSPLSVRDVRGMRE
jgi:putative spermidine/putrescine transport system ATP-binding protein